MRETSIEAFNQIKDEGLLSKTRFKVYEFIFKNGPCTISDVSINFNKSGNASGTYSSRFSELRNSGAIKEVGTTVCKITGRNKILWDVTNRLPIKQIKIEKHKCPTCGSTK